MSRRAIRTTADGCSAWSTCPTAPRSLGAPHDYSSELWIVEADAVEKGPIAKVSTGLALRSQVHGAWVARDKLEASKLK